MQCSDWIFFVLPLAGSFFNVINGRVCINENLYTVFICYVPHTITQLQKKRKKKQNRPIRKKIEPNKRAA